MSPVIDDLAMRFLQLHCTGSSACDEELRAGRGGGELLRVRVSPRSGERFGIRCRRKRPHAAAEPRAERRRSVRAKLSGGLRERDGLRNLIAEERLDVVLRAVHQLADRDQVAPGKRVGYLRDDVVRFFDELLEPLEKPVWSKLRRP